MKSKQIIDAVKNIRNSSPELDLEPCRKLLAIINGIRLEGRSDTELQAMSHELQRQAQGVGMDEAAEAKAFALAREAARRVLGMRPFDVQVIAGIAMHHGALVEMQTGEGKTLAAVLPAYLNALVGKGVHILTFNDYLAKRDAGWMGPVYEFLGLTVGHVCEGMSQALRRSAYSADITYLTAKEAGFDYLRSFLCMRREDLVQRPYNYAIIDEADSILIDEARIPLVIAGKTEKKHNIDQKKMAETIGRLEPQEDYNLDEYGRNVFLTDTGTEKIERMFGCGNLYDGRNIDLLVDVNNALHANFLLKRDVDYIVRNGRIELVDEFTGRVADKRQWPHGLQEAIEAKEGITADTRGQIMASVTLQNFIRLYPKVCGMTGTVHPSAEEFMEFYGLCTAVIPTNRKCIRIDHPDIIYTHMEAKLNALVSEIAEVHKTGRPILIGTRSVEESELLADRLFREGIVCRVLNAKNDEQEARIIANAGALGAVTVSTNMAGRGTDIRLGGEHEEEREKVVALGGLYVIGTNRHESRRVDNQLRGRAGRQGDPGSSRFFISLEDELMARYRLKELIPEPLFPKPQEGPVDSKVIRREIGRAQRIIEGQDFEIRRTLSKYAVIMERQRQMVHKWRSDILAGGIPGLMQARLPGRYAELLPSAGAVGLARAERQAALHHIYACWADYLDFMSYTRESIHLVNMAGKIPMSEFNKIAIESFDKLMVNIQDEIVTTLERANISPDGIDMEKEGLKAPSSTWTYLVDDSADQLGMTNLAIAFDPFSVLLMGVNMTWFAAQRYIFKKYKHLK